MLRTRRSRTRCRRGTSSRSKIDGLEGFADLTTVAENIQRAVQQFTHPDVESPKKATAVALGEKVKAKVPPPRETTVTVLNGNGVDGSASNAGYLLGQRGYRIVTPPNGIPANAPELRLLPHEGLLRPRGGGAKAAARKVANLFGSADVTKLRRTDPALVNDAMLVAVVGGRSTGGSPRHPSTRRRSGSRRTSSPGPSAVVDLLRERRREIDFPLMVPTMIERSSWIDRERAGPASTRIDGTSEHKAVRLTYRMGSNEYWGVQMTDWEDAPVLGGRNFVRKIGGRRYELYYNGPRLHMVVLQDRRRHATGSSTRCSTGSRTRR